MCHTVRQSGARCQTFWLNRSCNGLQALFAMWADFYQTSPDMHPEFFIQWGRGGVDPEAIYDLGFVLGRDL